MFVKLQSREHGTNLYGDAGEFDGRCGINLEIWNQSFDSLYHTNCCRKVGVVPPEKMRSKNLYICSVFRQLRDLMANICWSKHDIDNRAMALESTKGLLLFSKFHELWPTNGLKPDRSFTHSHYFVLSQFIAHPLCGINVAPHSDCKWNGIGFLYSSDLKPLMLSRGAALSGNTSL